MTLLHGTGLLLTALVMAVSGTLVGAPVPAHAAAKTRHDLVVAAEEIGGDGTNEFRIYGTVATFKGRNLTVQVRVNGGDWKFWKKSATAPEDGAFSQRIYGGKRGSKVCYKVVVPSTKRYRTTRQRAACITTDPA